MKPMSMIIQLGTGSLLLAASISVALADARVRVAHLAPFADTVAGTSVTVAVDGDPILEDFTYGDFTEYLDLPAGTYEITVTPTGAGSPAITGSATLEDDIDYTLAAVGNGSLQDLGLLALVDDNAAPAAGNLKLRVVHAAPFADTPEATEVSVRSDDGEVIAGLTNVPFNAASPVLEIPAGNYDLKVATPDGGTNLIDLAPLDLPAGVSLTVFATGDGVNQPLGFLALPLGELPTEAAVDDRYAGHWYNPAVPGQGIGIHPVPAQDRLFATWYTFGDNGSQAWYALDTCVTPGTIACNTNGFDGEVATFGVAAVTGGSFNVAGGTSTRAAGSLVVEFLTCSTATATYEVDGRTGSFDLVNLTPLASCTD
jgi:hypothetical protein